jgi:hypothetical protein
VTRLTDSRNMDDLFLPERELEVGAEIARGGFGAVHEARLYGVRVCAKVRRDDGADGGAAVRGVGTVPAPALRCTVAGYFWYCVGIVAWFAAVRGCVRRTASSLFFAITTSTARVSMLLSAAPRCSARCLHALYVRRVWSHGPRSEAVTRC